MASTAGLPEPPDKATLERLVCRDGLSDAEIAHRYGRTRTAISYWREQHGVSRQSPARLSHKDYLPWTVRTEDARHYVARMLRLCSAKEKGAELTETEERQRARFVEYLRSHDVVVDYDPQLGFGYRHRRVEDGDGLIRRPEYAQRAG